MRAVANCVTSHSARFGDQMPRRSPRSRPSDSSPAASSSTTAPNSRQVQRTPCSRNSTAGRSPKRATVSASSAGMRLLGQRGMGLAAHPRQAVHRLDAAHAFVCCCHAGLLLRPGCQAPGSMAKLKRTGLAFGARLVAYRANTGQTANDVQSPFRRSSASRASGRHAHCLRAGGGARLRALWRQPCRSPATGTNCAFVVAAARSPRHRCTVRAALRHGDAAVGRRGAGLVLAPPALGQLRTAVPRLAGCAQPRCRAQALVQAPPAVHRRHRAEPGRRRPGGHAGHRGTSRSGQLCASSACSPACATCMVMPAGRWTRASRCATPPSLSPHRPMPPCTRCCFRAGAFRRAARRFQLRRALPGAAAAPRRARPARHAAARAAADGAAVPARPPAGAARARAAARPRRRCAACRRPGAGAERVAAHAAPAPAPRGRFGAVAEGRGALRAARRTCCAARVSRSSRSRTSWATAARRALRAPSGSGPAPRPATGAQAGL